MIGGRPPATAGSTPAASSGNLTLPRFHETVPPKCGTQAAGAEPPSVCPHRPRRARERARPRSTPRRDVGIRKSFRPLLRDTREQRTDLGLPVPAVTPERADGGQLASLRPPRDGLRVDSEHRRDLVWREQRLGLGCACRHVCGLSSWTGTSILRLLLYLALRPELVVDALIWPTETILPSPDVTSRPPSAKFLCKLPRCSIDRCHRV